jgi:hypothetical protein
VLLLFCYHIYCESGRWFRTNVLPLWSVYCETTQPQSWEDHSVRMALQFFFFANPGIKNTKLFNERAVYPEAIIGFLGNLRSSSSVIMVIFTSTLKMRTESYSEIFVSVYQTTRRHIVREHNLHSWSVMLVCFLFCGFTACKESLYLCTMSNRTLVLDWQVSEQTVLIYTCPIGRWLSKCGARAR